MSFATDEPTIRRFLGEQMIASVMPAGGRVVPAPIYFNDKEDYWATIESVSYDTQYELETGHVLFTSFYLKNYIDLSGPKDSPLVGLLYEIYVFAQYDLERSDENVSPDAFNAKMLKKHNEFIALILDLKEAFQGVRSMGILDPTIYALQETLSLVQTEGVVNKAQCEFVPGIQGHSARFQETVRVQLKAC